MTRQRKSTFTKAFRSVRLRLIALREAAGLNQRQLAARLGKNQSYVARFETGERRLDLVEFFWVCKALGVTPEKTAATIMKEIARAESAEAKGTKT